MRTTFHLITGFLGSGKTTLLDRLLREHSQQARIAVIQNEFAPTGVDGKELKRGNRNFHLVEINNGSVFCVCQLGTFHQTMEKLLDEVNPEEIYLEASGLADPISIIDLLFSAGIEERVELGQIISLVDAPNFFRGLSGLQRFKHQLMVADTVIVNKMDLFEGELAEIESSVRELNPHADLVTATYADVDWQSFASNQRLENRAAQAFEGRESATRPEMTACVLRTHDTIDRKGLERFLDSMCEYSPRIKGFMGLKDGGSVSFHSVYEQVDIRDIGDYTGPSELIVFGDGLTVRDVRQRFKACMDL